MGRTTGRGGASRQRRQGRGSQKLKMVSEGEMVHLKENGRAKRAEFGGELLTASASVCGIRVCFCS